MSWNALFIDFLAIRIPTSTSTFGIFGLKMENRANAVFMISYLPRNRGEKEKKILILFFNFAASMERVYTA